MNPIREYESQPINLLLENPYLLNVREFMPTEIIRTIFITMIYYPNDSGGNANMHLARLPGEPISAKISKHWGSISTRTLCARLPSGLSNWVIKKKWLPQKIFPISFQTY